MLRAQQTSKGFTIVELLIVVVVIAILAAITIVAYNGITQRASVAVVQNALASAQKKIGLYTVDNADSYPATLSDAGLSSNSNGVTLQYSVNNTSTPKGYCVSATTTQAAAYYCKTYSYIGPSGAQVADTASSTTGVAPGHSTTGSSITNYVTNPAVSVSTSGYNGPNSTTFARDTSKGAQGSPSSVLVTWPQSAAVTVGVQFYTVSEVSNVFTPGTTYNVSAWVWMPSGTVTPRISIQGGGKGTVANASTRITTLKDQWARIYDTFTAGTAGSGNVSFYVLNDVATPTAGTQFWADSFMITEGTTPPTFADGNSPGWVWNGASGLSTSTGPAL